MTQDTSTIPGTKLKIQPTTKLNTNPDAASRLVTGSLHLEDIRNEASYTMKRRGATYLAKPSVSQEDLTKPNDIYNSLGLLPSLSPGTKKQVSFMEHSTISEGAIVVKDTITLTGKQVGIEEI